MSKSVEVSELSEGAFARLAEIKFANRLFAGHFNMSFGDFPIKIVVLHNHHKEAKGNYTPVLPYYWSEQHRYPPSQGEPS